MNSIEDNLETLEILRLIGEYYDAIAASEFFIKKAIEKIEAQKDRWIKILDGGVLKDKEEGRR